MYPTWCADLVHIGYSHQVFKNRRGVVAGVLVLTMIMSGIVMYTKGLSVTGFNIVCFLLGIASGYWGLFVTIASEQFGTNLRATVTTTVPNFVRGSVIIITLAYKSFEAKGGAIAGATWVGVACFVLAFVAI